MLTAKQLAKLLAVCPETLYTYVSSNLIPHCKIGTHFRFRGKDIAEWLRRRPHDIASRIFAGATDFRQWGIAFGAAHALERKPRVVHL